MPWDARRRRRGPTEARPFRRCARSLACAPRPVALAADVPPRPQEQQTWHEAPRPGRAARLGDPGRRRRDPPRPRPVRRGPRHHLRLRRQPVRADPPRQPARVPDRALRGRGDPAPRRSPYATCTAGTTTTGSARCRPASTRPGREHIGRPLSAVPDPWELPHVLGRALQGTAAGLARRARRGDGGGLADRAVPRRHLPRADPHRRAPPRPDRGRDGALPHQGGRPRLPRARRRPRRWPTPSPTTTSPGSPGSARPTTSPGSRTSPTAATAAATPTIITAYDDDTTDLSYTCTVCAYDGVTNLATDNEGKLVWKVDWPMRWAFEGVDFEPGGVDHASPGLVVHRRQGAGEAIYDGRAPSFVGYSFVGAGGQVKMSSSRGGVPTAADALKILEAPILRWLYVRRAAQAGVQRRLRRRGRAAVRRVGRARQQGRRPREARRAGAGVRAGLVDRGGRHPADARRSSCRSGCCRRSPT